MPQATIHSLGDRNKLSATSGSLNTSPLKRPRYTISEDQTKDRDVRKRRVLAFSKGHYPTSPPKRQLVPSGNSVTINPPQVSAGNQDQTGLGQRLDGTPPGGDAREDPEKAFKDLLTKYKNVKRLYFDGKTQIEQLNGQIQWLQDGLGMRMRTAHAEAGKHTPDPAGVPKHTSGHFEAPKGISDGLSEPKHNNIEKPLSSGQAEIDQLTRRVEGLQVSISEAMKLEDDE